MAHLGEVQVVDSERETGYIDEHCNEPHQKTINTADCPSGSYSDLEQSALMKVRLLKLQAFLEAKQELDEVETEVRVRAWRRSLTEKGDDLKERIKRQRLEVEALGVFKKEEGVRGAPRDSSFASKRGRNTRPMMENKADLLAELAAFSIEGEED